MVTVGWHRLGLENMSFSRLFIYICVKQKRLLILYLSIKRHKQPNYCMTKLESNITWLIKIKTNALYHQIKSKEKALKYSQLKRGLGQVK